MLQFCPCLVTTSKFLGCFCPLIGQLAPLIFWGKEIRALIILFFQSPNSQRMLYWRPHND